jgi:mono/diheme cytochrome c family protein
MGLALSLVGSTAAQAASASEIGRGRELAAAHCGRCHALERTGDSPLAIAPPFRDLGKRYPVEQLAEALAEGIVTGHPDMPEFVFETDDVIAMIAYLRDIGEPR